MTCETCGRSMKEVRSSLPLAQKCPTCQREEMSAKRAEAAVQRAVRDCIEATLDAVLAAFPNDLTMIRAVIRDAGKEAAIDGIVGLFEESGRMPDVRKDMAAAVEDMYDIFKDDGPLGPRVVAEPVDA